jgi:hypothetical protein
MERILKAQMIIKKNESLMKTPGTPFIPMVPPPWPQLTGGEVDSGPYLDQSDPLHRASPLKWEAG